MRRILVMIALLICVQLLGYAKQKRALVICVSEQEDKSWSAINTENDLIYVKELLNTCGYDDMCILTGKNATKQGIVDAFVSLASRCCAGDLIYVHFSGHGQRMTDVDQDESRYNSKDRYDESLIPYDAYLNCCEKDNGEKHLSDDEIGALLTGVKQMIGTSGQILVVVDACHSGRSTRDADDEDPLKGMCVRGIENIFRIPESLKSQKTEFSEDWLTLSACKDYQANVECVSPKVGKLTYMLYLLRRDLGKMTNDELKAKLNSMMNSSLYKAPLPQNPDLTGCTDKCDINIFF